MTARSSDQEIPQCVLDHQDFNSICNFSRTGQVLDIQRIVYKIQITNNAPVGPNTFCPDPLSQKPSPFVLAAQYGKKIVVDYFLKAFGSVMDIDHTATIISLTTQKKVHCATALWAASTGGYLDIVKTLVEHGAKVNKATLTQSTPLRGASFHGHIEVMRYLLDKGANINTANCIGQSPLCIAAMRGQLKAVKFLIDNGADREQKTINGYSVMHLSATKGRTDIVQYLLSIGMSPCFQRAQPSKEGYIPCPLFLAASTGQKKMVEELINHSDCPAECRVDAMLLLGSTRCEISSRGLTMSSRELWAKALEIREQENVQVEFLPPIDNYGNRVEIKDLEMFSRLSAEANFNRYEAYFQSLIIRERCMGYGDQGLVYFLIKRGLYFCNVMRYKECEQLWFRAMDMEVRVCELEIGHARYGHSEGLQRDLEKDLSQYADGIWHMVHDKYRPNFRRYIEFGFKELDILSCLRDKSDNALFIDVRNIISVMLYIMTSWLYYDTEVSSEILPDDALCSTECNELGTQFVKKCLRFSKSTTLLHHALSDFHILENDTLIQSSEKYTNFTPLIMGLLNWGAFEVIEEPDSKGLRPIHIAVQTANNLAQEPIQETVSPLVTTGAHVDAVDGAGNTAYTLCENDLVSVVLNSSGPLPLACHCARTIVREGLPYEIIGLPSHVVKLIRLHDKNCVAIL